ncbi:hypothetical protein [Tateyamaria sp. Alg231-49]|uniref:Nmad2 family putative nucleotide modification protein n=1 Tax=Tateyamaria sp. Alg231-49 TaxID=1922219 RepID=UPI00131EECB6
MRCFRYILAHDSGRAPCIDQNLITLATCKPLIRRSARAGDWVAAFMPRPHERGELVYAGRVADVLEWTDYTERYPERIDAVYSILADGSVERLDPSYHDNSDAQRKDLSGPILVLDADCSWYFGRSPISLPWELQHLAAAGRGHRVSGVSTRDVEQLEKWLRDGSEPGVHHLPRTPDVRFSASYGCRLFSVLRR